MSTCRETARAFDAYVDGELDASHVVSVEQHLASCDPCSARVLVLRATKRAIRDESVRVSAPASLRARIERSAATLRAPTAQNAEPTRPSWRSALPWAAAAAAALAVGGGMRNYRAGGSDMATASLGSPSARAQILDEFAAQHARPLPPEELDPVRITKVFSPVVGVPVRPVMFGNVPMNADYNFAGARLMALRDEPAATLFYEKNVGGARVTVFVYDPNRIVVRSACCLAPRVVSVHGEERTIMVGHAKGYGLAVSEHDGVGYALSADLAEKELVNLAAGL